jgi:uncharacterized protein YmfQ (DUF2313 family)
MPSFADKCKNIRRQMKIEAESPVSVLREAERRLGLSEAGKNTEERADAVLAALQKGGPSTASFDHPFSWLIRRNVL